MTNSKQRIAVIGAGPIGLEAALFAIETGYDVQVYEAGRLAANVARWGHVRLFSPFRLNVSTWGRGAVESLIGRGELPNEEALLTGREFLERYLLPLSRAPQLAGRIHEQTRVLAVGRSWLWKGDLIGRPARGEVPFQLLLQDTNGERFVEAEIVLDCSGTYGNPNAIGAGGMPCPGERETLTQDDYLLPDIPGGDRERFAGKRTLVIGSGYSAATSVVELARLAEENPGTEILWLTRADRTPPITPIENDPLAERSRLAGKANALALGKPGPVTWLPARLVRAIRRDEKDRRYHLTVEKKGAPGQGGEREQLVVDRVVANVGYRPDRSLYEELQIHECYASQGPMKLAAALLGETSADCLAQTGRGAETLLNPERGFFILGSKSYGRDSRFLLKVGIEQIQEVFGTLRDEN